MDGRSGIARCHTRRRRSAAPAEPKLRRSMATCRNKRKPAKAGCSAQPRRSFRPLKPCRPRWNGAWSAFKSLHLGNPGLRDGDIPGMSRSRETLVTFLIIVALAIVARLLVLPFSTTDSGDIGMRIWMGWRWLSDPQFLTSGPGIASLLPYWCNIGRCARATVCADGSSHYVRRRRTVFHLSLYSRGVRRLAGGAVSAPTPTRESRGRPCRGWRRDRRSRRRAWARHCGRR
jgi:hypothetical protein